MRAAIFRMLRGYAIAGCILLLALTAMPQEFPDELHLINGVTVKGQFITADLNTIIFRTEDGEKSFAKSEVQKLLLNRASVPVGNTPAPPPAGGGDGAVATSPPDTTIPAEQPTIRPVPTDPPEVIDAGVEVIEQAFRARDIDKVVKLCYPTERERLKDMFTKQRERLPAVADLLNTRSLTATTGAYAEFQVTDKEFTFPVTFERYDGVWCLSQL